MKKKKKKKQIFNQERKSGAENRPETTVNSEKRFIIQKPRNNKWAELQKNITETK